MVRQVKGRVLALLATAAFFLVWLLLRTTTASKSRTKRAPVALILAAQAVPQSNKKASAYLHKIIENREEYARHHGYRFILKTLESDNTYHGKSKVDTWARLHALREALEEHPDIDWFWYLDQDAVIMDPRVSIMENVIADLGTTMLRDVPVVPPDSVIRTIKGGNPENVQFILSQDYSGLNTKSFLLRNGDFAKYLLEAWTEPMYRSYGFERQEVSALEHLIQWHYTILSKTALLPKRILASYNNAAEDMAFKETDFIVVLDGCRDPGRSCELEFDRYWATRGRTGEAKGAV